MNETKKKQKIAKGLLFDIVLKVSIVAVIVALLLIFVVGVTQVKTNDMYPEIRTGDVVVYLKCTTPTNESVVIYDDTIGRVKACTGAEINTTEDGYLTIDGNKQPAAPEKGILYETEAGYTLSYPLKIKDGEYLVLGDNRRDAKDSRELGIIPKSQIKGTAVMSFRTRFF